MASPPGRAFSFVALAIAAAWLGYGIGLEVQHDREARLAGAISASERECWDASLRTAAIAGALRDTCSARLDELLGHVEAIEYPIGVLAGRAHFFTPTEDDL